MRSGTNWVFLRGRLDSVTTRTLATGTVSEVRLLLPLGRERERSTLTLPVTTWNPELAARLATLPRGTTLSVTGHLSPRRWPTAGGGERLGTEVLIDSVSLDVGDVWRQKETT